MLNYITGHFLAVPAIPNGTGLSMTNCLNKTVTDFGLAPKIEAVFDATGNNTGIWRGPVTQ